jgi:hypothetical protein
MDFIADLLLAPAGVFYGELDFEFIVGRLPFLHCVAFLGWLRVGLFGKILYVPFFSSVGGVIAVVFITSRRRITAASVLFDDIQAMFQYRAVPARDPATRKRL